MFTINNSNATFLGAFSWALADDLVNVTGIGYEARPDASNQVRIGNSAVTQIGGFADWTTLIPPVTKSSVGEHVAGLDFILKLRPVSYHVDVHELAELLGENTRYDKEGNKIHDMVCEETIESRNEKSAIVYSGFIPHEVQMAALDLGYDFHGVDVPSKEGGVYGLRYAAFTAPIIRAIQEQQAQIDVLQPQSFNALQSEFEELQEAHAVLLAENIELRSMLLELEAAQTSLREEQADMEALLFAIQQENEQTSARVSDILSMMDAFGAVLHNCCGENTSYLSVNELPDDLPRLKQNAPNPFNEHTLIRYYLPEGSGSASLVISDVNGVQRKLIELGQSGHGQVIVHGGSLPSGIYIYSLRVNGRQVDSKRMVLL